MSPLDVRWLCALLGGACGGSARGTLQRSFYHRPWSGDDRGHDVIANGPEACGPTRERPERRKGCPSAGELDVGEGAPGSSARASVRRSSARTSGKDSEDQTTTQVPARRQPGWDRSQSAAGTPDSNSPSSLDALMNAMFTALTRPRMAGASKAAPTSGG